MVVKGFNYSLSPTYDFVFTNVLGRVCAAPVFMFCMGIGIVYSRHSQWDVMIKRGVKLYLSGILVNIFEFFLPGFVCGTLLGRWDIFPMAGGLLLFCVDILAFAGLAFILMGILNRLELSNMQMAAIAVAMSLIGTISKGTDFNSDILNLFFANFIGSSGGFGAFPLFTWFIFPVAGYIWGQYFIRARDKNQFFKFWPIYIITAFIYFYITSMVLGSGVFSNDVHLYYFMNTIDAVFCIIFAHGIIGFCYDLSKSVPENIIKASSILSRNINNIYIAQWCLIPLGVIFLVYIFKDILFTDIICAVYSIFMLILSAAVAVYYKKIR